MTATFRRLGDKSVLGFSADGHIIRAGCMPFGKAVSHGTFAIITMDTVQSYVIRRWKLNMGVFVDDVMLIVKVILHLLCNGILEGCLIYCAAPPAALRSPAFDFLLDRLHLDQRTSRSAWHSRGCIWASM